MRAFFLLPSSFFLFLTLFQAADPVIDGRITDAEWSGARRESLSNGGELRLAVRGGHLFVAVRGPRSGLASLCVAKGSTVKILHASAAVGEARYERDGEGWARRTDFTWQLRDAPRTGGPTDAERQQFRSSTGWLANASAAGSPDREFQMRAADVDAIGVTFLATGDPMTVSYWPATMADDCITQRVPQGYLPETATFRPSTWFSLGP